MMSFKRITAALAAAAMLVPALPQAMAAIQVTDKDISINTAVQLRSSGASFTEIYSGYNASGSNVIKESAADTIQIFANPNGSHCGAYYQFDIPEDMENAKLTFNYTQQGNFNVTTDSAKLHFAAVGVPDDMSVNNAFAKVADIFQTAATEAGHPQLKDGIKSQYKEANTRGNSASYNVDITSLVTDGTNITKGSYALFVYAEPGVASTFYSISNASVSADYEKPPTVVWRASEQQSTIWSKHPNNKNGSYTIGTDNSVTMTATAADNLVTVIATAGGTSDLILKKDVKYTLHYTLSGSWTANANWGSYILVRALKSDGKTDAYNSGNKNLNKTTVSKDFEYEFTPNDNSYGFFYFTLRDVAVGDTMTVSNIYVTTDVEQHTVTFDSNGGSTVTAQKVFENETATEPAAPTREGCTFDGWLLNGEAYDFSTPVTSDITLTASWKSNTGDTLSEEKIDLTGSAVKLYRFPLTGGKYKYADDVTNNSTYKALVDGSYTDASIPANNYVMIDLGEEYNISTLKAYQNDITTAGTGGNFVAVLPGCTGTTSEFAKADLNDLIRTNASYNTLTTEHGTNCFTYSQLTSDKHNMGSYRYIILHNGGNYVLNLAEVEIYEDKTVKNAYLSVRNFYNDHMVLQRGKPHVIMGYSATGTSVSLTMTNGTDTQTAAATPDDEGNWTASIPAMPAGLTPYTITITDDKGGSVTLSDVLVGDVFLASGQSNMAYEAPRTATQNITQYSNTGGPAGSVYYKKGLYELQKPLANDNIRFIKMRDDTAAESGLVTENVPIWIDWMKSSDTVAETSSAGVATGNTSEGILQLSTLAAFFADARVKAEPGIPVGIIQASRGGSAINIWSRGGRLFNNHLAPLEGLNAAGILWYQGCANSNATGFTTYHSDFEALIKDYRAILGDSTLPFMYVQLAPYKNNKPEYENAGSQRFQVMREIQREMLDDPDVNTNLYMAVSVDTTEDSHHDNDGNIVNASLIHPLGKDTLGRRMAAAFGKMKDGTSAVVDGPLVSGATADGREVIVSFKSGTADGLQVLNPNYTYQHKGQVGWRSTTTELDEFKLAGADGVYYNATATVVGDTVKVTSSYVEEPKYVSYAYTELPKNPNLANSAGLPASPFNISVDGSPAPAAAAQTAAVTEFEVTMDSDEGSKVESQTVVSGKTAKEPIAPTKAGYAFAGWFRDAELTQEYDFTEAVTADMTLYAKWRDPVTFTEEKQTFNEEGSDPVTAYVFTATVIDGVNVYLGAAKGEDRRYFEAAVSGGEYTYGALSDADDITPIYK